MYEPYDCSGTILHWEEHIVPILNHPDIHIRDKALIAVQWESHLRPRSELHRLSFDDVEDRGDHMLIQPITRGGHVRTFILSGSIPYLKKWLQAEHPVTESLAEDANPLEEAAPETAVWTRRHSNRRIHDSLLKQIAQWVCADANILPEFTFWDIRRSRATHLAVQLGMKSPAFQERFGWGSKERTEFVESIEDKSFIEATKPNAPIQCPNCGEWKPRHQPCLWCETSS